MRTLFIALCIILGLNGNTIAQIGNNPFEPLLVEHNAKSQKLLLEMQGKAKTLRDVLVADLAKQIDTLKKDRDSEAAEKLSLFLNSVQAAPDPIAAADVVVSEVLPVATGAHGAIIEYLDGLLAIDKQYAPKLEKLKLATLKSMKQQLPKGQTGNPALVDRATKFMLDFLALPNPKFDGEIPAMPEDEKEASAVWKRTAAEFNVAWDRELLRQKNQFLVELYQTLKATAANNNSLAVKQILKIDAIFRSKPPDDLIQFLEDQKAAKKNQKNGELAGFVHPRDPSGWIMINLKNVDDSIDPVLESHMKQCAAINDRYKELFAKLDSRWAARNSKDLKKILSSNAPFETQFNEVQKQMRLSRTNVAWLTQSFNVPLPGVSEDAQLLLDALEKSGQERLLQADREDAELRNALIAKLKQLPEGDAVEESGKLDLIATLTSDYGEGIRGTLIFDVDPRLSPEALKLAESYLAKAEQIREKVFASHASKVAECRSKLKPKRSALLQEDDFLGAVLLDLHLARRSYPIPPIWIRYNTTTGISTAQADYGTSRPVQLLARDKVKGFLISLSDDQWSWVKRESVSLGYGDYAKSESEIGKSLIWINEYQGNKKDPPSRPVQLGQRLSKGEQVIVPLNRTWEIQAIADLSPFGVVVHPQSLGSTPRIEIIPRGIVRWITDQKAP